MLCCFLHILRRIFHGITVTAVFQHFYIVAAVPKSRALFRCNSPSPGQTFQSGGFVTAGKNQIYGTVPAGYRYCFPACFSTFDRRAGVNSTPRTVFIPSPSSYATKKFPADGDFPAKSESVLCGAAAISRKPFYSEYFISSQCIPLLSEALRREQRRLPHRGLCYEPVR